MEESNEYLHNTATLQLGEVDGKLFEDSITNGTMYSRVDHVNFAEVSF